LKIVCLALGALLGLKHQELLRVSTPSAITLKPKLFPILITALTIFASPLQYGDRGFWVLHNGRFSQLKLKVPRVQCFTPYETTIR
jgi:hypothetical protein